MSIFVYIYKLYLLVPGLLINLLLTSLYYINAMFLNAVGGGDGIGYGEREDSPIVGVIVDNE
jgi:hypothetical protein